MDIRGFARLLGHNLRDLLPIIVVIAFFQIVVIGEPMAIASERILGLVLVLLGLTFFVSGLESSIFPIGEGLADALARKGSVALLLGFAFLLGFGSTFAEPALAAVADQAAEAAANSGVIDRAPETLAQYSLMLRLASAAAIGVGVTIGVLRIVKGWPAAWFVVGGFALVLILTFIGPDTFVGIAMDSGAAATSATNVPLMSALGIGLATIMRGRSPLVDGFGVVALASVMPMLTILTASLFMPGGPA
ncbi:MAG: DUF1538 family protein [Hyphomicrobiaceae bacterium]|nr:DUF1538 family protein [Hyphomicrobiaceae bacterium]